MWDDLIKQFYKNNNIKINFILQTLIQIRDPIVAAQQSWKQSVADSRQSFVDQCVESIVPDDVR